MHAGQVQELESEEQVQELTVQDMIKETPIYQQDEDMLKAWIDPQCLKKVEGLWYKDSRQVVTSAASERRTLIQNHHDLPMYGHPGINCTIRLIERYYWWPNLCKEVTEYVQGCAECQRHKVNNRPIRAALSPIYLIPEALPFETVTLDFITKLPESQGYDSILTITDHDCTKMAVFIPC